MVDTWVADVLAGLLRRYLREEGQAGALVIALVLFILLLLLSGRRVVIQ